MEGTLSTSTGLGPAASTAQRGPAQGLNAGVNRAPATASNNPPAVTNGPIDILNQPAVKKSLPAILVIAALFVFALLFSWIQGQNMRTLYPGMTDNDRHASFQALQNAGFSPQLDSATGELKIPSDQYHEARLILASQSLPSSAGTGGFASLSESADMTTSQFMEQVKYMNAMEQELARSISQISTIKSARVHIAAAKQSVFVRDRTPTKASLVVTPQPGRRITDAQVQAIVHMVSSSIPYLAAADVAVIDHMGNLLTDSTDSDTTLGITAGQLGYQQRVEEIYRSRIDALLTPIIGSGNVQSVVNIELDFTQVESTLEQYDKEGKGGATRSEVLNVDTTGSLSAGGIPGAPSNLIQANGNTANGDATTTETAGRSQTTRNYELDRSVQHIKQAMGGVDKVSVAIVLNQRALSQKLEASAGRTVTDDMITAEIARLTSLVEGIVSYDANRGDQVKIIASDFEVIEPIEIETSWMDNADLLTIGQTLIAAIAFIALLMLVVRPAIQATGAIKAQERAAQKPQASGHAGLAQTAGVASGETERLLASDQSSSSETAEQARIKSANTYDEKVNLIRSLVVQDSGRIANVLKSVIKSG
jgi:flagellar M-ring protein FliF